jgi:hypothetical protein
MALPESDLQAFKNFEKVGWERARRSPRRQQSYITGEDRCDKPVVLPTTRSAEHQIGRYAAAAQPSMVASMSPIEAATLSPA